MRVLLSAMLVGSALLGVACSDAGDVSLRRSPTAPEDETPPARSAPKKDPNSQSTPTKAPPETQTPPETSDAGSTTPPVTPKPTPAPDATPGACGNPKCIAGGGLAGCKATDAAGNAVTMGCQGGQCACFAGNQTTSTFQADIASSDDAKQAFLTNCDCN